MSNTEALRAAAQQALDAMNYSGMDVGKFNRINAACRALREALAESTHPADVSKTGAQIDMAVSGEPVAHVSECEACFTPDACQLRGTCDHYAAEKLRIAAAPQPAPARVPLTEDEAHAAYRNGYPGTSAPWGGYLAGVRYAEKHHGIGTPAKEAP